MACNILKKKTNYSIKFSEQGPKQNDKLLLLMHQSLTKITSVVEEVKSRQDEETKGLSQELKSYGRSLVIADVYGIKNRTVCPDRIQQKILLP